MRLDRDVSYSLCSKLGSKLTFFDEISAISSFARPFLGFDRIFLSDFFFKSGMNPTKSIRNYYA
jgi:hypothetical protein